MNISNNSNYQSFNKNENNLIENIGINNSNNE